MSTLYSFTQLLNKKPQTTFFLLAANVDSAINKLLDLQISSEFDYYARCNGLKWNVEVDEVAPFGILQRTGKLVHSIERLVQLEYINLKGEYEKLWMSEKDAEAFQSNCVVQDGVKQGRLHLYRICEIDDDSFTTFSCMKPGDLIDTNGWRSNLQSIKYEIQEEDGTTKKGDAYIAS